MKVVLGVLLLIPAPWNDFSVMNKVVIASVVVSFTVPCQIKMISPKKMLRRKQCHVSAASAIYDEVILRETWPC